MLIKIVDSLSFKLFGIPVWVNPFLRYQVEVKFKTDVFCFWGGTPFTFVDRELLEMMWESIKAAQWHLNEAAPPERIYVGWSLYWKLLRTRNLVSDKKALKTK